MTSTADFFTSMFRPYRGRDDYRLELRSLAPRGVETEEIPPRAWFKLDDDSMRRASKISNIWSRKWDVYYGVYPRVVGKSGGNDAIPEIAYLYADFDGATELPAKAKKYPPPSHLVLSGGGLHGYYKLEKPIPFATPADRQKACDLVQRFVLAVGADPGAKDLARILRVPGTVNHKYDPAREVKVIKCDDDEDLRAAEWWDKRLPPLPANSIPRGPQKVWENSGEIPPALMEALTRPATPGQWHFESVAHGTALKYLGVPTDMIQTLLENFAAVTGKTDTWHQRELRGILRWLDKHIH